MSNIENKVEKIFQRLEEINRKLYLQNEEIASIKQQIKFLKEKQE
jgi:peptidoglycan hydrolase CwlO-like protein